jgi:hypothetical protein
MGEDANCYPNPCPQPAVCCLSDETCVVTDETDCGTQGGTWHVEWTSCDPNPCVLSSIDDASLGSLPTIALLGARPNPFRGTTDILFRLGSETMVTVNIYDAGGRLVRTLVSQTMSVGEHRVTWNGDLDGGGRAGAGVYLCRFRAGEVEQSIKIFCYR